MPPKKGSTKSKKGTKLAVPAAISTLIYPFLLFHIIPFHKIEENRAPIATVSGTNTNGTGRPFQLHLLLSVTTDSSQSPPLSFPLRNNLLLTTPYKGLNV